MGKYKIHAHRLDAILPQSYSFNLANHYGNSARLQLMPSGEYKIDVNGYEDDYVIENRAKRDPKYKLGIATMSKNMMEAYRARNEAFTKMGLSRIVVKTVSDLEKEMLQITRDSYVRKKCNLPEVSKSDIYNLLYAEAEGLFHKDTDKESKTVKYVRDNTERIYQDRLAKQKEIKQLFQKIEADCEIEANNKYEKEYQAKRKVFQLAIDGDEAYVEKRFDNIENILFSPVPFQLDYKYVKGLGIMNIEIEVGCNIEEKIPLKKASILASGRVSIKDKLQKEIRDEATQTMLAIMGIAAKFAMSTTPNIKSCRVSLYDAGRQNGICWINFTSVPRFLDTSLEYLKRYDHISFLNEYRGASVFRLMKKAEFEKLIKETEDRI